MRCRTLLVSLAVCISLAAPVAFAQQFSSLEERMSSADFKAAGLDKLSPEELARLNAFVKSEVERKSVQAREEVVREEDETAAGRIGFKDYQGEPEEITSTIPGPFKGWTTGTEVTLANGQVWRVIDATTEFVVSLNDPSVRIYPALFGNWKMQIKGYGTICKVERVK